MLILLLLPLTSAFSQSFFKSLLQAGPEIHLFPSNQMLGLRICYHQRNFFGEYSLRFAYNRITRHGYTNFNDDERGGAWGISPGYRISSYLGTGAYSFFAGLRSDIWWAKVKWLDAKNNPQSGYTQTITVQPIAELGFGRPFGRWTGYVVPSFGWQFNVITHGRRVGGGFTAYLGVSFVRGISSFSKK